MCHNYWTCDLEPGSWNCFRRHVLEPLLPNKRGHHNQKPVHHNEEEPPLAETTEKPEQQWRPSTARNKLIKLKKNAQLFKKK